MTYSVGPVEVERVVELESWRFAPADMFPAVTPELYAGDSLDFTIATYVVRTPDLTMLVDAGNGNDKHRPVLTAHDGFHTDYLDRLATVVEPEDVDVVVCTHLHPDHCGGLTRLVDASWVPVFPRARHLVPREELAWLQSLVATADVDGPVADLARTYEDSVRPVLDAGLIDEVDLPVDLGHGVTVRAAPGHTAGHVVVELSHGDEFAVVCGDLLHHPFQMADLALAHSGDFDPDRAHQTRRQLVEKLADSGGLLLPCHFGPGHVTRTTAGFAWQPLRRGR
ncbi:MBL fold metallo-hydrolase [Flexivirga sp. ID2601S]|uniref:MBL fold metallo-hydrolase n=1 Tax=Flexivirga aerilata TaxID=1656889 RepID=A0A849AQ45_9MICO|nr:MULTISPECIES: MBL fold metallo-hydrolase [Flexivirga]NNG38902.1 MBL fold metallo-hydrolase [Flexivirga aerilata]